MDLPSYSQSAPAPSYSYEPASGEQVLQHTPGRFAARGTPSGTFIRKAGRTVVLLHEQDADAAEPTYGRNALVHGAILLEDSATVTEVVVELDGKLETTISDAGGKSIRLASKKYSLWSKSSEASTSRTTSCPPQLTLNIAFPATFLDNGEDRSLPPSFHGFYKGARSVFARVVYCLKIKVKRTVNVKTPFWTKTKHIRIPIKYAPRTRPHRPILPSPDFLSCIKSTPEEWYQASSGIKSKSNSKLSPLPVHLFLPASRVYGLTDTIPFHLQISGPASRLRELFSQEDNTLDRCISTDSRTTASTSSSSTRTWRPFGTRSGKVKAIHPAVIRISITRQVVVELRGMKAWRNVVIGEGTLSSVPPNMACYRPVDSDNECAEEHLDWEGTLKIDPSVTHGGFTAANLAVKEFVSLHILPPARTPLQQLQVTVPIRIVTESYGDLQGLDTAAAF